MTVTLIKRDRIFPLNLPEKIKGQYWVSDISGGSYSRRLLGIEAEGGHWALRASAHAYPLSDKQRSLRSLQLQAGNLYRIYLPKEREHALLWAEEDTRDRVTFCKYALRANQGAELVIGRNADNAIVYDDKRVSGMHTSLLFYNGRWSVKDHKSENGTFVNQLAAVTGPLGLGDTVYIMGLTIIIGSNFIALNNPGGKVTLNQRIFREYEAEAIVEAALEDDGIIESGTEYFYRSPRLRREVTPLDITVDPPPQGNQQEDQPLALILGPSLTMGAASVAMAWFSINTAIANGDITPALPSIVMSASMLIGTVLWPILSHYHAKRKRAKKMNALQGKYAAYLQEVERQIDESCAAQEKALRESTLTARECIERIERRDAQLWERSATQDDFLALRVGVGESAPTGEIKFPLQRFEAEENQLRDDLAALQGKPRMLQNIPLTFSLAQNRVTTIIGRRNKCLEFANGLLVQLCALYGYDEVKTVFLYDEAEEGQFAFAKWLPHSWADDRSFRFIATSADEAKVLSAHLEAEIAARQPARDQKPKLHQPHYVIFAFSRELALRMEMLRKIYAAQQNIGFSALCFFDEMKNAPKECGTFIELKAKEGKIFHQEDRVGGITTFINDIAVSDGMRELALQLANIPLDLTATSYQLPSLITFMELFESGRVEHLNPFLRWQENDPAKSLQALVGVGEQGDLFYLDLHEKYHGPHGLVAGMTGSGKSEFIITYILSLALNYHPHEVAFLLIDYKGGGMAKSFESLPHVAGIITNLDGAAIRRSLISLESELKRRQAIFNEANSRLRMSNIDIYKYQKEYRAGRVEEPLPHLFIISDEFAELKTQQPEFMEQLISAARIGRSLGVHLVLATQKPAGVVNDQIWSNSRFRVCLKVQDKEDSMDMLKRADAAELKATGRFYLQVGYNELFSMGQSAWAGAPYLPKEDGAKELPCAVSAIDRNGQPIQSMRPERQQNAAEQNPKKQLDVITGYISQAAQEENIMARKLWLDPIEPVILLEDLKQQYPQELAGEFVLCPLIGEGDDPERQSRFPLYLPLTEGGNAIVYGSAGNGKTTLLTTLIYDLLRTHTAKALNLYIMDFGAETLRQFEPAPQVGEVITSSETEKIINLFKFLRDELSARKKLFSTSGGDYRSYCKNAAEPLPNILVALHNYAAFKEQFEDLEDLLSTLAMEGTKYGIFIILTAATTNAVRYNLSQNFNQLLVLRLNDEAEYSSLLGRTNGVLPARYKGRGLVKRGQVYEFQTAHIAEGSEAVSEEIRALCAALQELREGSPAKRIPILPRYVDTEFLMDEPVEWKCVPVGVNRQSLAIEHMDFAAMPVVMVSSSDAELVTPVAQGFAELLSERTDAVVTVLDPGGVFVPDGERKYQYCTNDMEAQIQSLYKLLASRNDALKRPKHGPFKQQVCIIPALSDLLSSLNEEGRSTLCDVLINCEAKFQFAAILGDIAGRIMDYRHDDWYETQGCSPSLWAGGGADGTAILRLPRAGRDLEDLEDEFGLVIRKGKYRIAKLLRSRLDGEDSYDA